VQFESNVIEPILAYFLSPIVRRGPPACARSEIVWEVVVPKRFHLAWFTNFTAGDWNAAFSHGGSPWDGKFFVEFAQAMERACFDYMILEDTLMVSEAWAGTAEMSLS
jgi:hypothetical protein